jgi:hypothetical protein
MRSRVSVLENIKWYKLKTFLRLFNYCIKRRGVFTMRDTQAQFSTEVTVLLVRGKEGGKKIEGKGVCDLVASRWQGRSAHHGGAGSRERTTPVHRNYAVLRAALRRGCYVNVARVVRSVRARIKKTELKRCCKFIRATGFTATWNRNRKAALTRFITSPQPCSSRQNAKSISLRRPPVLASGKLMRSRLYN